MGKCPFYDKQPRGAIVTPAREEVPFFDSNRIFGFAVGSFAIRIITDLMTIKHLLSCIGMFSLLMLTSCSSFQVQHDYDHNADFTKYKTYQIISGRIIRRDGVVDTTNTILFNRINSAIGTELSRKGMQQVESDPNLIVTYTGGAHDKQEIQSSYVTNPGYGWSGGPYYSGTIYGSGWYAPGSEQFWTRNYTEATLIFDMFDTKTKQLVYRAYLLTELDQAGSNAHLVKEAAEEAFKNYPPK